MKTIEIHAIEINQCYWVGNKIVHKDINDNWLEAEELTPRERQAFWQYLREQEITLT